MDSKHLDKWLSLYNRRLLSAGEFADSWLHEMVSGTQIDWDLVTKLDLLPIEIKDRFFDLIRRIREDDYRWLPILIGPTDPRDPTKYSAKLREICAFLKLAND